MICASIPSKSKKVFAALSFQKSLKWTCVDYLNAKTLIERDADFAKFAARILLTYVYEEVLGWDVSQHSIEEIRTFHAKEFKAYLKRGVAIKRLDKKLLKLDIERLCQAIDPSADLDFDYLGIQTCDATWWWMKQVKPTPFGNSDFSGCGYLWACLPMTKTEEQITALYNLYKSRRFCSSTPTL